MNKWILEELNKAIKYGTCALGHCIPMHKYVYLDGGQIVSHVLKMENLTAEFQDLMKQYQLPVRLERVNVKNKDSMLGVDDLSQDAISKINEWARLDFYYFGYEMLDPHNR